MIPKVALGVCLGVLCAAAHAGDAAADLDNSTWTVRCEDFFGEGKPLNIYPSRREGKWVWALGSSRMPGRSKNGWNVARYIADVSALTLTVPP
jgi:hypothetical protein